MAPQKHKQRPLTHSLLEIYPSHLRSASLSISGSAHTGPLPFHEFAHARDGRSVCLAHAPHLTERIDAGRLHAPCCCGTLSPLRGPLSQVRLWSQLDVTRLNDFQHLPRSRPRLRTRTHQWRSNPAAPVAHLACQFHISNTHASRTRTTPIATAQAPAAVHSHLRKTR